ncbi:MAG TPA: MEDS domain-containing protein [Gemmatimonadaceae bacterium]|nr:MEDS domain-containing protein [Gemmatimonadaceae bacterium]
MTDSPLHLAKSLSQTASNGGPTPAGLAGHDVHFYRSDDTLIKSVVDFLAEGIRVGQPIIVIATESHRRAFARGLRERDLDPDELLAGRIAVWLDARETLNTFMDGALPNRELFVATVGSVFERLLDKRQYLLVRAFGEMVDLLWRDGNHEAAILLEKLWNELAATYKYSLLCGYSIDNFLHEAGVAAFRRVCDQHTSAQVIDVLEKNVA